MKKPAVYLHNFRRHILVVQHQLHRCALGHKNHQQGNVASGVGQQQRGGGGATGGSPYGEAGGNGLTGADIRLLLHHLVNCRADIHGQIHHRAGRAQEDGRYKNLCQIQVLIAGVEQALAGFHNRAVNSEQIRKQGAQHRRHQNTQSRAGYRREEPSIPAVNQHQNHRRQHHHQPQGNPDGIISVQ